MELEVEEFKRGTEVGEIEGAGLSEVVERGLSAMQVKAVLFEGKDFGMSATRSSFLVAARSPFISSSHTTPGLTN